MEKCVGQYRCVVRVSEIGTFGYIFSGDFVVFEVCATATSSDMMDFLQMKCEV